MTTEPATKPQKRPSLPHYFFRFVNRRDAANKVVQVKDGSVGFDRHEMSITVHDAVQSLNGPNADVLVCLEAKTYNIRGVGEILVSAPKSRHCKSS